MVAMVPGGSAAPAGQAVGGRGIGDAAVTGAKSAITLRAAVKLTDATKSRVCFLSATSTSYLLRIAGYDEPVAAVHVTDEQRRHPGAGIDRPQALGPIDQTHLASEQEASAID